MTFKFLDINKDGQLSEDEFVDGCLGDPMMMCMLESLCDGYAEYAYGSYDAGYGDDDVDDA